MTIPRILHRIWVGSEPMPEPFAAFGARWEELHPEWEHRLWTEDNLPDDLERRESLDRHRVPAERADVLRYELLWRHGGVYVDADMEPLRPLDPLLEGTDFFVGDLKPGRINNAIFGAAAHHPLLEAAKREARFMEYDDPADAPVDDIKDATGPRFLDTVASRFPDITRLAPEVFYPKDEDTAEAYTYHHAARTWFSTDPVERERLHLQTELDKTRRRLVRAEAQLAEVRRDRDEIAALLEAVGSKRWLFRSLRVVVPRLRRVVQARRGTK